MGEAVAAVHADLARQLGTAAVAPGELATGLRRDVAAAVAVAPLLAPYAPALNAAFQQLSTMDHTVPVQRIHGDLHLGQTLRTPTTWWLLDFEGEPARPLTERTALRSPWHDVACMLRSFEYAGAQPASEISRHAERRRRADRWVRLNRSAFVAGYALRSGRDPRTVAHLLRALELARVVYEVTYEARNRPEWIDVPLAALRQMLGEAP
jgi:maltokinase